MPSLAVHNRGGAYYAVGDGAQSQRMSFGGSPDDPDGWAFDAPRLDRAGELLTLALLEDLSALLSLHGYPPLRGYALSEVTFCLQRIHPH